MDVGYSSRLSRSITAAILAIAFVSIGPRAIAADTGDAANSSVAEGAVRPQTRPAPYPHPDGRLDQRVKLLSVELGLDAQQQAAVRNILLKQREQVMKTWSDGSVPAEFRATATGAISEHTGDAIRALLNEEQKKKYNQARKPREADRDAAPRSVDDWMNATRER